MTHRLTRPQAIIRGAATVGSTSLLVAHVTGCCFGGLPSAPPPVPSPLGGSPSGSPGPTASPTATGASSVTLAPGFAPDPTLVVGNAGGPVDATTFGAMCRGTIATTPNVTLTTTAMIPNLRVVVNAPSDTTLVVRLANGQVLCDDDSGGNLNPLVSGSFPPGQHQVYVGTFSPSDRGVGFTLGLTVNPSVTAGTLGTPPPPTVLGAGLPTDCGLFQPAFGPLSVGTSVVLGAHSPYTGPNGQGGVVRPGSDEELNWVPEMQRFVGMRTTVTSLEGLDGAGCTVVKVAADNGTHYWRVRDMRL